MSQTNETTRVEPRTEYDQRMRARSGAAERLQRVHHRIGNSRLALFFLACLVAWHGFKSQLISPWWLAVVGCAFVLLVAWHSRVVQRLERVRRAIDFYERGIARLEERWQGAGEPGTRFSDPAHPYAEDLDLFGKGSLFELLCSARTGAGEQMLASWLKSPAQPEEIRARQEAVQELRPNLQLREDLSVLGADIGARVHPDALVQWGEEPATLNSTALRVAAAALALVALGTLALWIGLGQRQWFFLTVLVELVVVFFLRRTVGSTVVAAEKACSDLKLLSEVLARIEKEQFETPRLQQLRAALETKGETASRLIAKLNSLIVLLDSRRNPLFAPVAFVLLWEMQLAFFVQDWRRRHGKEIAGWIAAAAEIEALSSFAGYAFEHPYDPFPEITDQSPCFEGRGLGHPLLHEGACIRNDVELSRELQVLVISGSNMSGKSTLLRTVGINAVLALAGAPVRAKHLRLSPLALGASIHIMDSLQEGTSRFYAEITRLRQIVEIGEIGAGKIPLLFLLDELLNGTNSHDRRIGAEAVIKGLAARGALGLLTTHDLALAHIAEALAPRALNVHFEDHLENGRMAFDYRLRPGVVQKSNALELMRSIGLSV